MLRGLIKPFLPVTQLPLSCSRRYLFIASIGNPEPQYANTRHNAGHRLMNQLIDVYWKDHVYKKGPYYLSTKYSNLVLFKSNDSLMNLQGLPISKHFGKHDQGKSALVVESVVLCGSFFSPSIVKKSSRRSSTIPILKTRCHDYSYIVN